MATRQRAEKAAEGIPVALVVVLLLLLVGGAGFWYLDYGSKRQTPQGPVLRPEAKAYVRYLKLSEVQMKATESYLKQTVVEVEGKISNNGDRPLRSVEINCVFYDAYGQVVLRERVAIVKSRTGGLKPGETKNFRLPFDYIPQSWNQNMPQLVIAQILFD